MKENSQSESINIKYCRKGDRHYRMFNCLNKDFHYDKLISLFEVNSNDCLINMYICNSSIKEEILIESQQDFEEFISSDKFSFYLDAKYNCLKLHFIIRNQTLNPKSSINNDKLNELINDKTSLSALDFILTKFNHNKNAKKDLKNFLVEKDIIELDLSEEIYDSFFNNLFKFISKNYETLLNIKSSNAKLKLDVSLGNFETESQGTEINFASIYNISELNRMTCHEVKNATIFCTSNIIMNDTIEINKFLNK